MLNDRFLLIITFSFLLLVPSFSSLGQESELHEDSLFIEGGSILFHDGEIKFVPNDTTIYHPDDNSLRVQKDPYKKSKTFYDSLEEKMGRTWFTRELYNLLFRPESKNNMADTLENIRSEKLFEKYEGYVIDSIYIMKVDILEGSVDDTLLAATSGFGKFINDIHVNTQDWVLSKFLLFERGDPVRPYLLADNERIVRNLSFIEDARIRLKKVSDKSVNVYLITQDILSLGIDGAIGNNQVAARIFDKNLMGSGGEVSVGTIYEKEDANWGMELGLEYNNFWGSFINGRFRHVNTSDFDLVRFGLEKEFLTPQIKYAGELDIGWKKDIRMDKEIDTTYEKPFQLRYSDVWVGRSFILDEGLKRTNLILALRTGQQNYMDRPLVREDSNAFFHDKKYVLSSIAIKKLSYLKSSKVIGFGQVEDVPYGYMIKLLGGYSSGEFYQGPYFGFQFTAGKYFDRLGYFGVANRLGTFWRDRQLSEMLLTINVLYYTPLISIGRYQLRNIIRWNNSFGVNKIDKRGVHFSESIRGFQNEGLSGLGSYVLSYENIIYTPWYYYGFKFAPFVFADVGILSEKGFELKNTKTFSSIGFGFRLRNESLTIRTIELRFAYLPKLVESGSHVHVNFSVARPGLFNSIFVDKPTFNTVYVD